MSLRTSARAQFREDRAGDPLDGLVNMFDLGIVLAVAFFLAALTSLGLTGSLPHHVGSQAPSTSAQTSVHNLTLEPQRHVVGAGTPVGTVYRLRNGQLIYVTSTTQPLARPSSG